MESMATAVGATVQTASGLSMLNASIPGAGYEPAVVAAGLGLEANAISTPVIGNTGVYVVQTVSVTPAAEISDYSSFDQDLNSNNRSRVTSGLANALKDMADVTDNRFSFY